MPSSLRRAASAALLACLAAPAFAAGAHDGGHGHHGGGDAAIGEAASARAADRTVEVVMRDSVFDPESIRVKPGETIRFRIRNAGDLVHEFGIGTPRMHKAHRAEMREMMESGALAADHVNMAAMEGGHGHGHGGGGAKSVLLEPGETGEIVWKFPHGGEADLSFACNVPGHYAAGMVGEFRMPHGHDS